jgi:hypothetical protein
MRCGDAGARTSKHQDGEPSLGGWRPPGSSRSLTAVAVTLREITDNNRQAVLALRVAPEQVRLVGSVERALEDAAAYPQAKPWSGV